MTQLKTLFLAIMLASSNAHATPYEDAMKAGAELQKAGQFAGAQAQFEKALATDGITSGERARALLDISTSFGKQFKWVPANEALEKVLNLEGVSGNTKVTAYLAIGNIWVNYGDWARVKAASAEALKFPEISAEQKITAQKAMVKALSQLEEHAAARLIMRDLLASGANSQTTSEQALPRTVLKEFAPTQALPETERAALQIAIAKTFMHERNYAEARAELTKAQAMPGLTDALKVEIQLVIALSYYDAGDYENAKPELLKVSEMPGAEVRPPWDGGRMAYVPGREAMLRLHLRHLIPDDKKALKVLFIGSSHTLRGNIPKMVKTLANSAPPDRPRILVGDYVKMGTGINTFWNAGDSANTARGVIAAEPWDAVVFETFYNMNSGELLKYGTLFGDLIRSQKAKPVIYESPLPQAAEYPAKFQAFHNDNLALMKSLKASLAPGVKTWMNYLGPKPTPDRFAFLYDDWIHASPKGAYITACSVYAALTGFSPVGLAHPGLSEDEARPLQELAWEAFQESNSETQIDDSSAAGK